VWEGGEDCGEDGRSITNPQWFLTLSSLVEGLNYKFTGSKLSITSDDSLFADWRGCGKKVLAETV